jgi:cell division protein FtsI (penicillin-binding protein 3)
VRPAYQEQKQLQKEIYRGTVAYGYSLKATFMQLLVAYNAFNNNGNMVTPSIVSHIVANGKKFQIKEKKSKSIISSKTASQMKKILIKTVEFGTGVNAQIDGVEIGGKTGTAHIAKDGKYINKYVASFFGFANDIKKKKYTIGVTVFEPTKQHFASLTSVKVFKDIVDEMVYFGFLTKKDSKKSKKKNKKQSNKTTTKTKK